MALDAGNGRDGTVLDRSAGASPKVRVPALAPFRRWMLGIRVWCPVRSDTKGSTAPAKHDNSCVVVALHAGKQVTDLAQHHRIGCVQLVRPVEPDVQLITDTLRIESGVRRSYVIAHGACLLAERARGEEAQSLSSGLVRSSSSISNLFWTEAHNLIAFRNYSSSSLLGPGWMLQGHESIGSAPNHAGVVEHVKSQRLCQGHQLGAEYASQCAS